MLPLACLIGKLLHDVKMSGIPGHAWQLPGRICNEGGQT
jgi:hypothetical protein